MSSFVDKTDESPSHERRRYPRYIVPMHVVAVLNDESQGGHKRVLSVQIKDISKGGVCGVVEDELSGNEQLILFVPPQGGRGGRDVRGRVTRCEKVEGHFRIGMSFTNPLDEAEGRIQ
ncbi:MAG: PilZ domain-containing protein [Planctomycetes bacterium]|nr:PilZ domain-containing protein [Planctomycetota bacterium]